MFSKLPESELKASFSAFDWVVQTLAAYLIPLALARPLLGGLMSPTLECGTPRTTPFLC